MHSIAVGLVLATIVAGVALAGDGRDSKRGTDRRPVDENISCRQVLEQISGLIESIDPPGDGYGPARVGDKVYSSLRYSDCNEIDIVNYLKSKGMKIVRYMKFRNYVSYRFEFYTPKFGFFRKIFQRPYVAVFAFDRNGKIIETHWGSSYP